MKIVISRGTGSGAGNIHGDGSTASGSGNIHGNGYCFGNGFSSPDYQYMLRTVI